MMIEDREASDDGELAGRVRRSGDELAFRILYRRHSPRLYQLLLRLVGGSRADAEDLLQEVWIRAVERFDRVDAASGLYPWLRAIGLNVVREGARRFRRRLRLLDGHGSQPQLPAEAAFPLRIDLDRAIATLPDGCRRVLVLHDVEGFTHEQIAEQLGIAAGTSKSQLAVARTRLRQTLSTGDGEGEHDVDG